MPVQCTNIATFNSCMAAVPQILQQEITRALTYLGEQCIIRIRDRSGEESWFDRTGNLRSSIGYSVFNDGHKAIESAFEVVKNGSQGAAAGQQAIDRLAEKYASTYDALVVVAGMEYAELVEALDAKDVLASTELWAKQEIQKYLDRAKRRAIDKISRIYRWQENEKRDRYIG